MGAAGLSEAAELVVAVNSFYLVPWWIVNLKKHSEGGGAVQNPGKGSE